jgi:hypothetical protein
LQLRCLEGEKGEQREHAVDRSTIEEPTLEKSLPGMPQRCHVVLMASVTALVAIKELFEPLAAPE